MDSQVPHPNNQDRKVDGQDPEHEDEDGVGIVVEVVVVVGASVFGQAISSDTGG